MYDLAYILAIYNQPLKKILRTINSLLLQTDVNSMIIIADDGSKANNREEIEQYFKIRNYNNYLFLESKKNMGTVSNLYRCREYCGARYTKLISPGDCIYGYHSMRLWIDYMDSNGCDASVANVIYYNADDKFKVLRLTQCPWDVSVYKKQNKKKIREMMLVKNDLWLGAATLCRTNILFNYLELIHGKVKYGEDNIYRIMAADEINLGFVDRDLILYERGNGVTSISTYSEGWHRKLMNDWTITTKIIIENHLKERKFKKRFLYIAKWKIKSTIRKSNFRKSGFIKIIKELVPLYFRMPDILFWHIKLTIFPRYSGEPDMMMVREIMEHR